MATYTVTMASLLCAHANIIDPNAYNNFTIDHHSPIITDGQNKAVTVDGSRFVYANPNEIIKQYARSFFDRHVGTDLKEDITDQADLNDAIYNRFCENFIRHFYGYEIGQENPEYFFVLLNEFLSSQLPIWYQGYEKLFIDKAQWITNDNQSHSLTKSKNDATQHNNSASIAGRADTPQNELNFKMNTGDPTDDYNFSFASEVNGSKGTDSTNANSNGSSETSTNSSGRNSLITDLLNSMLAYENGIYFDLFNKAKNFGLFMQVY